MPDSLCLCFSCQICVTLGRYSSSSSSIGSPWCLSVLRYWPVPPVVTRGVEPSELNGKHIVVPRRCRINLKGGRETMTEEYSCPRQLVLIAEGTTGELKSPTF